MQLFLFVTAIILARQIEARLLAREPYSNPSNRCGYRKMNVKRGKGTDCKSKCVSSLKLLEEGWACGLCNEPLDVPSSAPSMPPTSGPWVLRLVRLRTPPVEAANPLLPLRLNVETCCRTPDLASHVMARLSLVDCRFSRLCVFVSPKIILRNNNNKNNLKTRSCRPLFIPVCLLITERNDSYLQPAVVSTEKAIARSISVTKIV